MIDISSFIDHTLLSPTATYNDFKNSINTNYTGDSSAEKASVFPYNVEQDCYQYRQASVGYVQAKFMENQIKTAPEICHKVHDGIIMKEYFEFEKTNESNTKQLLIKFINNYKWDSIVSKYDEFLKNT